MFSQEQLSDAADILDTCRDAGLRLVTAESCTGGLIAGCLTSIAGSSDVLERGYVVYSNESKHDLLGVTAALIDEKGAVSQEVARAMAEGAVAKTGADLAVAVTGIAGPGGGTTAKPVGLVHIAVARAGHNTLHERHHYQGDRETVRLRSLTSALKLLKQQAG